MNKSIPTISIIIPMYNAEKYIGDCLDSILAQTFKNYEVIVVDDCSTDKSCEIVESYLSKFNGKLNLFRSKKNSTSPSVPRNKGILLSRGEYICFLDSDDGLIPTALEEIYNLTQKFNVDVIHCGRYYLTKENEFTTDKNFLKVATWELSKPVDSPTFLTDNLAERVNSFLQSEICIFAWCHIVRRDFLLQHNIIFPPMRTSGDYPYTFHILYKAKTFLRVPNMLHVYRRRDDSQSRLTNLSPNEWVHRTVYSVLYGLAYLNKLMSSMEFFIKNPQLRYDMLDTFFLRLMHVSAPNYAKIPSEQLETLIQIALNDIEGKTELIPYFFSRMNNLSFKVLQCKTTIKELSDNLYKQKLEFQKIIQAQAAKIKQLEHQLKK